MTSMQRSFLGDVSPPSSMGTPSSYSSTSMLDNLGASLISSNDFTNINYFMAASNTFEPSKSPKSIPHKDDSFDRLFDTSQPTFDAESMLNSMCLNPPSSATTSLDCTVIVNPSETMSHIQDDEYSSDTLTKSNGHTLEEMPEDESQTAPANATFANVNAAINRTLVIVDTVKAPTQLNVTVDKPKAADAIWEHAMNDTFQLDQVEMANCTFDLSTPVLEEEE